MATLEAKMGTELFNTIDNWVESDPETKDLKCEALLKLQRIKGEEGYQTGLQRGAELNFNKAMTNYLLCAVGCYTTYKVMTKWIIPDTVKAIQDRSKKKTRNHK